MNESFTYEEVASVKQDDDIVDVVAELEELLQSGYSELLDESQDDELEDDYAVIDLDEAESPFPMGVQVFDVSESENYEMLGSSSEAFEDYQVICASEAQGIPLQTETQGATRKHVAAFMM